MATSPNQKGGARGTVFREVARLRFTDAEVPLENRRFDGALYLAGFAIECHLKFAVCIRKEETLLPAELEVHDSERLVAEAGLAAEIKTAPRMFSSV